MDASQNHSSTALQIILASASPRRAQLLRQVGIEPVCLPANIDETPRSEEGPQSLCRRLAQAKAASIAQQVAGTEKEQMPVLGSDTIVVLGECILGQPRDAEDARSMLRLLSGRTHQVMTAVALWHQGRWAEAISISDVSFRPLREAEIQDYVATGEPMDKAGAYAIQGRAAAFIPEIRGSYSGIMGLPLFETLTLLQQAVLSPGGMEPGE